MSRRQLCTLLLALGLASPSAALRAEPYADLAPHKAEALAIDPTLRAEGVSRAQPTEVAAALRALAACAERRGQLGIVAPCELVRLNDAPIVTGREIRGRVGSAPHPLFLWRVSSATAEVYLAGSVHALKASLYPLPGPYEAAFERADTLVVEVDTVTRAPAEVQQKMLEHTLLPAGVTLEDVVAPATLAALNAHLQTQGIPLAALAMLKPVMIATQLSVNRLMAFGYLPEHGMEQHFIRHAGVRTIVELETLDEQLELLTGPPLELQEQLLLDTLAELPTLEHTIADLIVAWLSGDDLELRRLFDEQAAQSEAYQAFMEQLLGARNRAMSDRIEGFLESAGRYFVLIGAAHLTGADGIVALLERRGYTLERIRSDDPGP